MNTNLNRLVVLASLLLVLGLIVPARVTPVAMAGNSQQGTPTVTAGPKAAPAADTPAVDKPAVDKPTIVLVHGAFADATGWQYLIPLLQSAGYPVVAVQNPLTSLEDDVATTKRAIDAIAGPVIAVGHSYGGAVISGAAADNPNVVALVYIAAFAPDANEPLGALLGEFEPSLLAGALVPDAAGFVTIDPAQFHTVFAGDVTPAEASVMAITQKPVHGSTFEAHLEAAAWHTVPAWYMVATQDNTINPDLERFYAERMEATTVELDSSHLPFISYPSEVFKLIETAAQATAE